jgi:ABC-type glycerol-3-phosphate transport system permease component
MLAQFTQNNAYRFAKYLRVILRYITMILLAFLFFYPLLFMLGISFLPPNEVMQAPPPIIGSYLAVENYELAMQAEPYLRSLLSTLVIISLGTLGNTLTSLMAAYSFSRLRWPGKEVFFNLSLMTMMIPSVLVMIPMFILWSKLGLIHAEPPDQLISSLSVLPNFLSAPINELFKLSWGSIPLWLVYFGGSAYDIFLLRQFMRSVPTEMFDAAEVDGASEWQMFWRIMTPLCAPAIIIIVIFHVVYMWHDLLGPLLYLAGENATLSQSLARFSLNQHQHTPWEQIMAYAVLITLPLIILFLTFQRYFMEGISISGLKE